MEGSTKRRGARPRPRVALVGGFSEEDDARFKEIFPTVWVSHAEDYLDVTPSELDLLVLGDDVGGRLKYAIALPTICFSSSSITLPGPNPGTGISSDKESLTEEYVLPKVPLSLERRRRVDLQNLENIKGRTVLTLYDNRNQGSMGTKAFLKKQSATKDVFTGGVIVARAGGSPLAISFERESGLGLAWLPLEEFDRPAWAELIVTEWAKSQPGRFPGFADWSKSPDWMTGEESRLREQIEELEHHRDFVVNETEQKISIISTELNQAMVSANSGSRRLLTSQDDELVEEVINAFGTIGFHTQDVDETLPEEELKREDIRLTDRNDDGWEALVEVRGYARSGGKTADLIRLQGRFSDFYTKEKGRPPNKLIYVVNGPLELGPHLREKPLATSVADVRAFAESGGLVISSLDLYKAINGSGDMDQVKQSIKDSTGLWAPLE